MGATVVTGDGSSDSTAEARRARRRAGGRHQRLDRRAEGRRAHPRRGRGIGRGHDRTGSASTPTTTGWRACRSPTSAGCPSSPARSRPATRLTVLRRVRRRALVDASATAHARVARRHRPATDRRRALPRDRARRLRPPADRPANAVTTYGMTETGSGVVYDRRPLDGVEVRIVDGRDCSCGARCCCAATATAPTRATADGWFPTGDLGDGGDRRAARGPRPPRRPDHHRRRERVARAGRGACCASHPGVADVAWSARHDDRVGPAPSRPYVVPDRSPRVPPSLADLREHVEGGLAAFTRATFDAGRRRTFPHDARQAAAWRTRRVVRNVRRRVDHQRQRRSAARLQYAPTSATAAPLPAPSGDNGRPASSPTSATASMSLRCRCWLLRLTGDARMLALASALAMLPWVVVSLPLGVVVDRLDRRG